MDNSDNPVSTANAWGADEASRAAGMSLDEVEPGRSVISMTVRADMVNGLDVCHGGYVFLLADSAMAFASNSGGPAAVAAAANIDFIAPARLGDRLTARAMTQWSGGRTALHDVEVTDHAGRLIARFHGRTTKVGSPKVGSVEAGPVDVGPAEPQS